MLGVLLAALSPLQAVPVVSSPGLLLGPGVSATPRALADWPAVACSTPGDCVVVNRASGNNELHSGHVQADAGVEGAWLLDATGAVLATGQLASSVQPFGSSAASWGGGPLVGFTSRPSGMPAVAALSPDAGVLRTIMLTSSAPTDSTVAVAGSSSRAVALWAAGGRSVEGAWILPGPAPVYFAVDRPDGGVVDAPRVEARGEDFVASWVNNGRLWVATLSPDAGVSAPLAVPGGPPHTWPALACMAGAECLLAWIGDSAGHAKLRGAWLRPSAVLPIAESLAPSTGAQWGPAVSPWRGRHLAAWFSEQDDQVQLCQLSATGRCEVAVPGFQLGLDLGMGMSCDRTGRTSWWRLSSPPPVRGPCG